MGLKSQSDGELLQKIESSLNYLGIRKIDKNIGQFFETNYNHFFSNSENSDIKYVSEDGFIICKDNSTFKLKMTPSYIYPDKICMELYNLDNKFIQSYVIEFLDSSANMIKIIERKHYNIQSNDNQKLKKRILSTIYLNSNKYYEKKLEVEVDSDDVYSTETNTWYPRLDDTFVKSYISLGEISKQQSSILYEKGDLDSTTPITEKEFKFLLNKNNSSKSFKKYKKCA